MMAYLAALAVMAGGVAASALTHDNAGVQHSPGRVAVAGAMPSSSGGRYGYHGPYYPRPGRPYLMVGCDVLNPKPELPASSAHVSHLRLAPHESTAASALPLPEGRRWWHDYNSGLPAHLVDVSKHSIALQRTDLEGWIVPDSTSVLPPPPEEAADTEARAPFREEYTRWLEGNQTVGSPAWLTEHAAGLPYIPPNMDAAPRDWQRLLPEHLRELSSKTVITWVADGGNWMKPGSIDFPGRGGESLTDAEAKLRAELKQWLEDHMTEGFGIARARHQLEMRCRDGAAPQQVPVTHHGPAWHQDSALQQKPASQQRLASQLESGQEHYDALLSRLSAAFEHLTTTESYILAFILSFTLILILRSTFMLVRLVVRRVRCARFARSLDEVIPDGQGVHDKPHEDGARTRLLEKA